MQDFELESPPMGVDHSQKAKATPIGSDYNSKDCINLLPSTAVSRIIRKTGSPLKGNRMTQKPGLLFILSAPAGTGKTTLSQMLVREFPSCVASVSYTTRPKRPREIDGVHYHFVSEEDFLHRLAAGEFLEHASLYGYYYGTSRFWVEKQLVRGAHVLLVIDTQGAAQIRKKIPNISIFISPPSLEALEQRLIKRNTESAVDLQKRLEWAKEEMLHCNEYDYSIINEDLAAAYESLRSILIAEEHRLR